MPHDATGASLPELLRSLNLVLVRLGEQAERLEHEAEHREMLARAQEPPLPPPKHRTPAGQRWLHVVRGFALLAAGGTWRWLARTRVHRVLAGGLVAATAAGSTLAPEMMQRAPAALVPAHHYHAVAHHHRPVMPAVVPAVPARRTRRRLDGDRTVRPGATVSPSASPVPSADPEPTVTPPPRPTVPPAPPPPVPSPRPTCLHPAGRHCQGLAGEVLSVPGALRGLPGLINQGVPSLTSSVLNPGPRLEAGRTVTVKHAATRARRVASGRASHSSRVIPV